MELLTNIRRFLPLFCLLFFPWAAYCGTQPVMVITKNFKETNIGPYLSFLPDNTNQWEIEDVSSPRFRQRFRPNLKNAFFLSPPSLKTVWIRFQLKAGPHLSPCEDHLYLELGRPRYKVDFYQPLPDNPGRFIRQSFPGTKKFKSYDGFRHLVFRLKPPGATPMTWFVRIEVYGPEYEPFTLRSENEFRKYSSGDSLMYGMLYGILFGMIVYNFFLYVSLKQRLYLQYVIYIISFILYLGFFLGHFAQLLKPDIETSILAEYTFLGLSIIVAVVFCRNFFDLSRMSRFWNYSLYAVQLLGGGIIFSALFKYHGLMDIFACLSGAFGPATALTIGCIQWHRGFKPAGFYILANVALTMGIAGFIFWNLDLVPRHLPGEFLLAVGPVIESLLLSFALAFRIRTLEAERLFLLESRETYKQQSRTDGLTGLYNRKYMFDWLNKTIRESKETGIPLSLILMDVDNFKQYNDTYGHPEGDKVLSSLARIIMSSIRNLDVGCRYGGEEFAVLLPDTGLNDALQVAERIRNAISALEFEPKRGTQVSITVSMGISTWHRPETSGPLVERADQALYEAKHHGKNTIRVKLPHA